MKEETKIKISKTLKLLLHNGGTWLGKNLSEEHKNNISNGMLNSEKFKSVVNSDKTRKNRSESHKGEKCYNWKGGISYLPYCERFNEKLKESIRERDNRICQECGKTELENGKKLTCHHIHYKKEDCDPDLISLCISCNSKVNFNRNYWEEHFMVLLINRGLCKL